MKHLTVFLFALLALSAPALSAPTSASERKIAREVLVTNAKSYKRFTNAKFSSEFKKEMEVETKCIDSMTEKIKKSPDIKGEDETFSALLNIYTIFPFDYIISSSRDKKELVRKEASRLFRGSQRINQKASSAEEKLFVSSLRSQAQTVLILSRIKGNVDFCQIEKNIGSTYTLDTVGMAFDAAFEGSWGPELVKSKGFNRASKIINEAIFKITMLKPRFPEALIDKFVYPPSLGMMIAWAKTSRAFSLKRKIGDLNNFRIRLS